MNPAPTLTPPTFSSRLFYTVLVISGLVGLYLTTHINYLLFHSIVEMISIIVAAAVFIVTWSSIRYINNPYLITVGISYLFIGFIDLLHTLAYKGMPIFTDYDYYANQLWIAARYLESLTLLISFALLLGDHKVSKKAVVATYLAITTLLLASIFYWKIFPACFVEGKGLTPFKVYSEYAICTILFCSLFMLNKNRDKFRPNVYQLLFFSIIMTIISELAFTFYISNYGISNIVGHYFKLFSFMLIYQAVVTIGIKDPYQLIFNDLNEANLALASEIELRKQTEIQREEVIQNLQSALNEIKVLKGILPICMHCKKIRDDSGYWNQLEHYIVSHSHADFSHGICPGCMETHYSKYATKKTG
jgi:hypothetical protein